MNPGGPEPLVRAGRMSPHCFQEVCVLKYVPMVVRNALRNRTRTVLTVAVVMLGTGLLFAFLAVERSVDRTIEKTGSGGHVIVQEEYRR